MRSAGHGLGSWSPWRGTPHTSRATAPEWRTFSSVGDRSRLPRCWRPGLTCEGGFSKLVRFNARPEADAVPLSELAGVCLEAAGGETAGLVIAGETAGLAGARLRRSPASSGASPVRFDVPDVREWLSFAPERTYAGATALIAGVVARKPAGPLRAHLRRLGETGDLYGHLHTAVFSYRPLPQRTVELGDSGEGTVREPRAPRRPARRVGRSGRRRGDRERAHPRRRMGRADHPVLLRPAP